MDQSVFWLVTYFEESSIPVGLVVRTQTVSFVWVYNVVCPSPKTGLFQDLGAGIKSFHDLLVFSITWWMKFTCRTKIHSEYNEVFCSGIFYYIEICWPSGATSELQVIGHSGCIILISFHEAKFWKGRADDLTVHRPS